MRVFTTLKGWLEKPLITGRHAFVCSIAALVIPTMIRCTVDSEISGVAFSPYIPFVLLTAVLLGWKYATGVALASAIIADLLFIDPRFEPLAGPTDAFGILIFLVSAALIIFVMQAARLAIGTQRTPVLCGNARTGLIFSLEKGQAWLT